MNTLELSGILNGLPDDMILEAYQSNGIAFSFPDNSAFADSRSAARSARISAPHWMTAAALAACMLFAVGVGTVLLRTDRDEATLPSSQACSEITTGTAAQTVTAAQTASLHATAQTSTVTVPESMQPAQDTGTAPALPAAETLPAEPEHPAQPETEQDSAPETTGTQTETSAPPESAALSPKVMKEVVDAIAGGETKIPVQLTYQKVNVEQPAREKAAAFEQTLDPDEYTPEEINRTVGDYYIRIREELYEERIRERAVEIMEALGIDPETAICYTDTEKISCMMTPGQIAAADQYELITRIAKRYTWTYSGDD